MLSRGYFLRATAATTDPASYVYNQAGIVHLMPSCALPLAIDKGFHRSFRVCFPEERTFQATADFVTEVIDATTIAVLHDSSPAAARLADGVQQAMARLGAQIVANEAVSPNPADAPPLLEELTTANPEVVYVAGSAALAAGLMKQARDAGAQVVWVLSSSANVPELASLIGPRGTTNIYVVADPLPGQPADQSALDFAAAYQTAFSAEPTLWGAMAADAVALVQEAVRGANSTDPQVLAGYLHERLRGVAGITGPIEGFDSAGNRLGSGDVVLILTPGGRLVPNEQQP